MGAGTRPTRALIPSLPFPRPRPLTPPTRPTSPTSPQSNSSTSRAPVWPSLFFILLRFAWGGGGRMPDLAWGCLVVVSAIRKIDPYHMILGPVRRQADQRRAQGSGGVERCDLDQLLPQHQRAQWTAYVPHRGHLQRHQEADSHWRVCLQGQRTFSPPGLQTTKALPPRVSRSTPTFVSNRQDSGLPNTKGAGLTVATQALRAQGYKNYTTTLAPHPSLVGFHWFQWVDQPVDGRESDGENSNFGLVNKNGTNDKSRSISAGGQTLLQ
jgi:hypothetical protein